MLGGSSMGESFRSRGFLKEVFSGFTLIGEEGINFSEFRSQRIVEIDLVIIWSI